MNNRIHILISMALTLVLTGSCVETLDAPDIIKESKNQLVLGAQQVAVSKDTKAPVSGTTFPTSLGMVLSAYASTTSSNWFTQIPFTYVSADGGWKATTSKYWPQTGTLDFLAYSCPGLSPTVTYASNASTGITSFVTGDNRAAQADLMFGAASGCSYSPSSLPTINFKHAMSLVTFKALCPDASFDGTTGITIESITFANAYYGGTCSVTRSGSSINNISWSAMANAYNGASVPGISSAGLTTTQTTIGSGMLLPPQNAVNFTINYKVWSGGVGTARSYTYSNSGTWTMGYNHVYAIEITLGNDIVVKAGVEDWADTAKTWFYADGNVVKNVGNAFTLTSGQPVWWREGTTGAYEQLSYYSGTYGTSVTYAATNYYVTVTKSGDTYTVSYVSKDRIEYDYQIVLSAPHNYVEAAGTMQLTATLQKRQRTWSNGSAYGWSSWTNESVLDASKVTWSSNSEYATVNSSGMIQGNNDNGSGQIRDFAITATWTSYLGGISQTLTTTSNYNVLGGPIQVVGCYMDVWPNDGTNYDLTGPIQFIVSRPYILYNTGERVYIDLYASDGTIDGYNGNYVSLFEGSYVIWCDYDRDGHYAYMTDTGYRATSWYSHWDDEFIIDWPITANEYFGTHDGYRHYLVVEFEKDITYTDNIGVSGTRTYNLNVWLVSQ